MAKQKPKDFIQNVLIDEIGTLIEPHPYISFILMGIGIEFLGKCIDLTLNDWNISDRSKRDFENAIKTIPSLKNYEPHLKSYDMYSSFRCGLAHAVSPKYKITLSSQDEMEHLNEYDGRLNLKVEDFYKDFKDACNYVIDQKYPVGNKMNDVFLEIPDDTISSSGTTSFLI